MALFCILIKWNTQKPMVFPFFSKVLEVVSNYCNFLRKENVFFSGLICHYRYVIETAKFTPPPHFFRGSGKTDKINISFTYQGIRICFTVQISNMLVGGFVRRGKLYHKES